jgi:nucleoside-diphosphate-sugar epimerase
MRAIERPVQGSKVCVVGGAGFIGSHVVDHLIEDRDCSVVVIDNLVTGRTDFVHDDAKFEHYDVTGSETYLRKLFVHHQIEYVFNYAAEPYIPVSFQRPIHVCNTNFFGAIKVINAAQEAGCEGILQVSSAEIYGNQLGPIDEKAPVCPHSSYGASKAAIDFLVQARWKEAGTPCISLRQFNCVGERETHPYVIPEIISQVYSELHRDKNKTVGVDLGNNSVRDFQYAGDAAKMAVELLERGELGEVYNMGSQQTIHIYDLAELIGQLMDCQVRVRHDTWRDRPWEIWHLRSDNAKLYKTIGSRPSVSLQEALLRTIADFNARGHRWPWEL